MIFDNSPASGTEWLTAVGTGASRCTKPVYHLARHVKNTPFWIDKGIVLNIILILKKVDYDCKNRNQEGQNCKAFSWITLKLKQRDFSRPLMKSNKEKALHTFSGPLAQCHPSLALATKKRKSRILDYLLLTAFQAVNLPSPSMVNIRKIEEYM